MFATIYAWLIEKAAIIAGAAVAALAIFVYGYSVGSNHQKDKQAVAQIKLQKIADENSAKLVATINDTRNLYETAISTLNGSVNSLVTSVRNNRGARRVPTAASDATCRGSTGADLSAEDAEFLIREAGESDRREMKIQVLQSEVNSLREAMCIAATGKPCL